MSADQPQFYTIGPWTEIDLGFTTLPTYYLIISLTYCLCILWFYKRCENRNLPQKNAMDLCLIVLLSGFVGARLGHVLFEYPSHYAQHPEQIFYFWQGGFVFYGGALLAYLCAWIYARRLSVTFWLWHDTAAPVLALGYALGRLACFAAGCCYGKICHWPWAVNLKQADVHTGVISEVLRHPTQLYASGFEFLTLALLIFYEKKKPRLGMVFLVWITLHALGRIVMEAFRDDPRGPTVLSLSVSTTISIAIVCVGLYLIVKKQKA